MSEPETCITCGDVAVPLVVVSLDGADALCRADDGGTELVAVELVAPVLPGDRVLVHARVAIEKLETFAKPVVTHERRSASGGAANSALPGRGTLR